MNPFDLTGKCGLVLGIANDQSIAYGCASVMHGLGATLGVTYLNAKAEPYVRPLAEALGADLIVPCDVREDGQLEAVFAAAKEKWGRLDFVVHSIAFAPRADLHARVTDCTASGFGEAMTVSAHSFIQCARLAEPLMTDGGALITLTFYGSERVVAHYNLMGPVKAALESSVRYLTAELGEQNIRVHAVSPGAMPTRAASGIDRFDELLNRAAEQAPVSQPVLPEDVGNLVAFLVSDAASKISGTVIPIDGGQHVMA